MNMCRYCALCLNIPIQGLVKIEFGFFLMSSVEVFASLFLVSQELCVSVVPDVVLQYCDAAETA